jgi:hypothetical protein
MQLHRSQRPALRWKASALVRLLNSSRPTSIVPAQRVDGKTDFPDPVQLTLN